MTVTHISEKSIAVLGFIECYIEANGWPPTMQEICDHFGYSSKSTVFRHIRRLEETGYLEVAPGHKRQALRITRPA